MQEKLLDYVLKQLQAKKGSWPSIAKITGLDYSWLTKLAQGKIPDPSVNKIQVLADYFRGGRSHDRRKAA